MKKLLILSVLALACVLAVQEQASAQFFFGRGLFGGRNQTVINNNVVAGGRGGGAIVQSQVVNSNRGFGLFGGFGGNRTVVNNNVVAGGGFNNGFVGSSFNRGFNSFGSRSFVNNNVVVGNGYGGFNSNRVFINGGYGGFVRQRVFVSSYAAPLYAPAPLFVQDAGCAYGSCGLGYDGGVLVVRSRCY